MPSTVTALLAILIAAPSLSCQAALRISPFQGGSTAPSHPPSVPVAAGVEPAAVIAQPNESDAPQQSGPADTPTSTGPIGFIPPGGIVLEVDDFEPDMTLLVDFWILGSSENTPYKMTLKSTGAPRAYEGVIGDGGHWVTGRILSVEGEAAAKFTSTGFKPGRYTVSLELANKKLAERTFSLIELPTKRAVKKLAVNFAPEIYQAYVLPTPYARSEFKVVVPTDTRRPLTYYSLVQIANGEVCSEKRIEVKTYHLVEKFVRRLVSYAPIDDILCRQAASGTPIDVVLFKDAGHLVGSWRVEPKDLLAFQMELKPTLASTRPVPKKVIQSPLVKKTQEELVALWKTSLTEMREEYFARSEFALRSEATLCAAASTPRAFELMNSLAELDHSTFNWADRYATAQAVEKSRWSTARERAAARREQTNMVGAQGKTSGAAAKVAAKFKKVVSQYKDGCFQKLFPAEFAAFVPASADGG